MPGNRHLIKNTLLKSIIIDIKRSSYCKNIYISGYTMPTGYFNLVLVAYNRTEFLPVIKSDMRIIDIVKCRTDSKICRFSNLVCDINLVGLPTIAIHRELKSR